MKAEYEHAKELRENEESYIRSAANKHVEVMFEGIPDKRGKRLEEFCKQIRFPNGTNALKKLEEQEKALRAKSRGLGR